MARQDRTVTGETGHTGREEHKRWLEQLTATQSLLNEARASESTQANRGQRRRKLNELKRAIVVLQRMIQDGEDGEDGGDGGNGGNGGDGGDGRGGLRDGVLSEHEKNRRRNIILSLLEERDVLVQRLSQGILGEPGSVGGPVARPVPRETEETAIRSNAQLLQVQRALIEDQDEALDHLERSVGRTKRIALGVYEETELQNRLLEDFDEEVGMTSDVVYNVRQRVRRYLAQRGMCGCCGGSGVGWLFILALMLMIVLVVVLKVVS
jgi:hypothetical protein